MKPINVLVVIMALLAASLFTGCASRTDMESIQTQRQRDRAQVQQLEQELQESRAALKAEIERSNDPVRQKTADIYANLQSLRVEIAKLRGDIEATNIRMNRQLGTTDSETTLESLEKRIAEIEFALTEQLHVELDTVKQDMAMAANATTMDANGTMTSDNGTAVAPSDGPTDAADPAKALYDKAYEQYKQKQFETARSYWAEFVKAFPDHTYVASALFWQGQCYYNMENYARAAILFDDVIQKYSKSAKYKAALLRQGYALDKLGKTKLATLRMQEVLKKFPDSVEATQAKRYLEKLN